MEIYEFCKFIDKYISSVFYFYKVNSWHKK